MRIKPGLLFWIWIAVCVGTAAFLQSSYAITADYIELEYPDILRFHLALSGAGQVASIQLVYDANGRTCQEATVRQPVAFEAGNEVDASWDWELKRSGTLPPGVVVTWHWEITDQQGNVSETPAQSFEIQDPNHNWFRIEGEGIVVQWYAGGTSFGQEMHQIALASLDKLEQDMGIRPISDIIITVYPSAAEVREAVLFTPDWTGGVAYPAYNATIIGVGTGETDWANLIVPHELAHLVVGTLTFNCKGVSLPTWLDEGLAEVAEGSLTSLDLAHVVSAIEEGALPRLTSLERGFSAFGDAATLSYLQSGFVVQYLIDTFGPEALADFLALVQSGKGIESALVEAYQLDTNGLDAAWRLSLGFEVDFTDEQAVEVPTEVPTLALVNPGFPSPATPTVTAAAIAPVEIEPTVDLPVMSTPETATAPVIVAEPAAPSGEGAALLIVVVGLLGSGLLGAWLWYHKGRGK